MSKFNLLAAVAVGVLVLQVGCGKKESTPAPTPVGEKQIQTGEKTPEQFFAQFIHEEPPVLVPDPTTGLITSKYLASEKRQFKQKPGSYFQTILSLNQDRTFILHYEELDGAAPDEHSRLFGKRITVNSAGNWHEDDGKLILEADGKKVAEGERWTYTGKNEHGSGNAERRGVKLKLEPGFEAEGFKPEALKGEKEIELSFVTRAYLPKKEMMDNNKKTKIEDNQSFRSVQ